MLEITVSISIVYMQSKNCVFLILIVFFKSIDFEKCGLVVILKCHHLKNSLISRQADGTLSATISFGIPNRDNISLSLSIILQFLTRTASIHPE